MRGTRTRLTPGCTVDILPTGNIKSNKELGNAQLNPHERLIAIADGPWTVGNGLMTPTFKIKRAALEGRYQAFVDNWERHNSPVVWESAP